MIDSCVGVDPGLATGVMFMDYDDGRLAGWTGFTVPGERAVGVIKGHLLAFYSGDHVGRRVGSVEHFVTGQSAGSRGKAADVTRQLEMEIAELLQMWGYKVKIRPAADVKPWASNKLMVAAGIPLAVVNSTDHRHAVDAGRHCVYGARASEIVENPLATVAREARN